VAAEPVEVQEKSSRKLKYLVGDLNFRNFESNERINWNIPQVPSFVGKTNSKSIYFPFSPSSLFTKFSFLPITYFEKYTMHA